MPKHKYSFAPGDPGAQPRASREHFGLYDDALLADRGHRADVGRGRAALGGHHQPRRRDSRARSWSWRNGPLQPAEAARHPRHQGLQGPHLPHQPLGLSLHRRRLRRRPHGPRRQARRHHRHRRHGRPVRAAPGRVGEGALRLPAHALVRSTCATMPRPTRHGRRRSSRAGSGGGMDNFNILVAGGDQEEDLVHDGWTDIFRKLTGTAAKKTRRKLGRRLDNVSAPRLMQLADYQEDEAGARAGGRDRQGPGDRRGAQALVPPVLQAAVLPRRVPADLQPAERPRWSTPMARASSG